MNMRRKNTTLRARAGRVYAHPLKSFFMNKHISQYRLAEMVGSSQGKVNKLLNGLCPDPDLERRLIAIARDHGWKGGVVTKESRVCQICRKEEPRQGMQVCDTCLGHGPGRVEMKSPKKDDVKKTTAICRNCGNEFEPYKRGAVTVKKICKTCLAGKMPTVVHVNFSGHEELYRQVVDAAGREFRNVNQQILYLVAGALGRTDNVYMKEMSHVVHQ
jgi:hypothetical protein